MALLLVVWLGGNSLAMSWVYLYSNSLQRPFLQGRAGIFMGQQYSIGAFFRRMPNELLGRFFAAKGVFAELDFGAMKQTEPAPLIAAWNALPDQQRAALEAELRAVHAMSNKKGLGAIQDAARTVLEDDQLALEAFMARLVGMDDYSTQAMTAYLEQATLWPWAERFHHADRLGHWKKRNQLPKVEPAVDPPSLAELSALLKDYFTRAEGRGRNCLVEHYRRGGRDYYFAFPEDHATRGVEWEQGAMAWRAHNPAFDVVFVYAKAEGSLNLFCRGAYKAVAPLQTLFAKAILKQQELPPERKSDKAYELNALMSPSFEFVRDMGSGVGSVVVKKLRLSSWQRPGDRITLEADGTSNRRAIYELLEQVGKSVDLANYKVTQVDLSAEVWAGVGKPPKTVNFQVTHPNSCSLKFDEMDEQLWKMLAASGIEARSPDLAAPAALPAAG